MSSWCFRSPSRPASRLTTMEVNGPADEPAHRPFNFKREELMRRQVLVCLAFCVLTLVQAVDARQGKAQPAASLYERLGGVYPIALVVDDFIERLLVNDTLNANPAIRKARSDVPKQGLKFQVTTLVRQATRGPD